MRKGIKTLLPLVGICLLLFAMGASVQGQGAQKDAFKGELFPPNVTLEHQGELDSSKEQLTAIRAALVKVQASVAEHEWELREAYLRDMADLDESPVAEEKVLESIEAAVLAENRVRKLQVVMLIQLRNLLTGE